MTDERSIRDTRQRIEEIAGNFLPWLFAITTTFGLTFIFSWNLRVEVSHIDIETLKGVSLLEQVMLLWRPILSNFMASLLSVVLILLYWNQFDTHIRKKRLYLIILEVLILSFSVLARFIVVPDQEFWPYIFPMAALSMMLTVIFDVRMSGLVTMVLAALFGYMAQQSLELTVYMAASGLIAVLTLKDYQRINGFFRAGMIAAVGGMVTILIFHLPTAFFADEAIRVGQLLLTSLANGVLAASLTLGGFFLIGTIFGVITTLQLQELSRLDHPLLRELLQRAPGTYHHSIMVANLAEQAAERIGANSALVRVGAFFHDIGKMNRPPFFTENQEGPNPHDALDPHSSARIIISHVTEGLEMARRHRLPLHIQDFIAEHHGDRVIRAFYRKAVQQANGDEEAVDENAFRHVGPRPRSRETGIVQLADAVEATSSALRPNTEGAIEKLVTKLIEEHLQEGQLDNSNLTLGDIRQIRNSFIETLKGRFHVRVRYPGNEELELTPAELVKPAAAAVQGVDTAEADPVMAPILLPEVVEPIVAVLPAPAAAVDETIVELPIEAALEESAERDSPTAAAAAPIDSSDFAEANGTSTIDIEADLG